MLADFLLANRPLWAVLISLIAGGLILLAGRWPNLREAITLSAAAGKLAIVVSLLPVTLSGQLVEVAPLTLAPGIALHLRADALGLIFAALAASLWLVTSIYSIGYMRSVKYGHETGYYASFAVSLSATIGIAFAANLLTFFIFYEILTIATYPLVVHRRTPEAIAGGRKYLAYTLGGGQLLLIAVLWAQAIAPGAEFQAGGFLAGQGSQLTLQVLFILFVLGIGVKAAVMPLHDWLPTAMVAPTPVSALLHAVAVVKAGAFGFVRLTGFVFGPQLVAEIGLGSFLAWLAAATIIIASLRALAEDNLKRRLAYSTVGQLSYVVLGVAIGTPAAMLGAMFHIVAHAFMKITLFFCAGAVYATTHKENVSEMDGLGRRMPFTMAAFTAGSLGIVGTPFFVGFISKWNLGIGSLQAGQGVFIAVLIVSALLSSGYFFPIIYQAYFGNGSESKAGGKEKDQKKDHHHHGEARAALLVPLLVTAAVSLLLGVAPNLGLHFYDLATMVVQSIGKAGAVLTGGG